jgi:hypothetical protein
VLASGSATLVHEGHAYGADQPEIISRYAAEAHFTASDMRSHRLFGVGECLRLRKVEPVEAAERFTDAQRAEGAVPGLSA